MRVCSLKGITMRRFAMGACALSLILTGCETSEVGALGQVLGEVLGPTGAGQTESPSLIDIDAALRQALEVGSERVTSQIGVLDGYWQDPQIRIPLPGRLGEVQSQLAQIGLSGPFDDLQLRMNRAAEQAVPVGKTLVVDAIKAITIEDAVAVLRGGDTAATDFLRGKTEVGLRDTFTPYVETALQSSGAYQALDQLTASNPLLTGFTSDFKSSLTTHAVQLGLEGFFGYLAVEEKKIRDNPLARSTELLKRVFGSI